MGVDINPSSMDLSKKRKKEMNPVERWHFLLHRLNLYTLRLFNRVQFLKNLQEQRSAERRIIKIHKSCTIFIKQRSQQLRNPMNRTFFLRQIPFHQNEITERKEFIQEFSDQLIQKGQRYVDVQDQISTQKVQIFGEMENLLNQNPFLQTQANMSILHPPVLEPFLFDPLQTLN